MPEPSTSLPETYLGALRDHVAHPNEATLQRAYELGRTAMNAGLGIFDLIRLHHQALAAEKRPKENLAAMSGRAPALESFLLEALSSFEAAYRGFRSTRERLQELNDILAERNEAFALSNAQLEEEVSVRQKIEADLRESKDHYFQLFQEAHAMKEDLRELSAQVLSAQEEERKRISRELHDEIAQALIAVNVAIALLKKQAHSNPTFRRKVTEAEQLLEQSMETVHRFARELRPAMLEHLGVESALRSHVASFAERTGLKTEFIPHANLNRIGGPRAEALFRVAQEALTNVFKHAHATAAKVEFSSTDEYLTMEITDNGCAFCVDEKLGAKPTGRLGLVGMRERVRLVSGIFAIESVAGRGTRLQVQIPLAVQPARTAAPQTANALPASLPSPQNKPDFYEQNIRAVS